MKDNTLVHVHWFNLYKRYSNINSLMMEWPAQSHNCNPIKTYCLVGYQLKVQSHINIILVDELYQKVLNKG